MTSKCLFCVALVVLFATARRGHAEVNITIGILTAVPKLEKNSWEQMRETVQTISDVIEKVNSDRLFLKEHTLQVTWTNSDDPVRRLVTLTQMWKDGANVLITSGGSCSKEASLATEWNLPMITTVSKPRTRQHVTNAFVLENFTCIYFYILG